MIVLLAEEQGTLDPKAPSYVKRKRFGIKGNQEEIEGREPPSNVHWSGWEDQQTEPGWGLPPDDDDDPWGLQKTKKSDDSETIVISPIPIPTSRKERKLPIKIGFN